MKVLHLRFWGSQSGSAKAGTSTPKRSRRRRSPLLESLEIRQCLSTMTAAVQGGETKHAALVANIEKATPKATAHPSVKVIHYKKAPKLTTVYVRPGARAKPNAGKTAARPIGSINKALSLVKAGGTIVLAPGVYTENVVVSKLSNVKIVGAPGGGTVLAPAGGDAMKIALSDNISVSNVWFRSANGRGLAIMGASVNLNSIQTNGTRDDGVVAIGYQGRQASLNAVSSRFDAVQLGAGLHLQQGSTSTISGCTFDGNGTSPNATQASNGLVAADNAVADITGSEFNSNTHGGMVALDSSSVTVRNSTFAANQKANGMILIGNANAELRNNTFAANGQVRGAVSGLNGLELLNGFTGHAYIDGNAFVNNTANGIFVGSATNTIWILNNVFDNNFIGLNMDTALGSTVNAVVQGNTISLAGGATPGPVGILAIGHGLTATIGGDGVLANSIRDFIDGAFIYEADGDGNAHNAGFPNLTVLTNNFSRNGQPVSRADAIHTG